MCFVSLIWVAALYLLYRIIDVMIRLPCRKSPSGNIKNIMITGCDSGFGKLFALRMAKKGFRVYASCITMRGKQEIENGHQRIKAFMMDLRDSKSIHNAYKAVQQTLGPSEGLWALVNNAGMQPPHAGPSDWLIRQDYQDCCEVNLFGMIEITTTFMPLLKRTRGRIVNTSSVYGRMGFPCAGPYCVSKHGVEGYSKCLRLDMKVFGISVHVIEPGYHTTNLTSTDAIIQATQRAWDRLPEDIKQSYGEQYLTKSIDVICKFIPFICSPRLEAVVDIYEHAVLSYFPRGRYLVGKDARLLWWPLSQCPEWMYDLILNSDPNGPVPDSCKVKNS